MVPTAVSKSPLRAAGLWVFAILFLLIGGCREEAYVPQVQQQPVKTVTRDYWVRVLLSNNIKSCVVKVPSPYSVVDAITSNQLGRFTGTVPAYISGVGSQTVINSVPYSARQLKIVPDQPFIIYIDGKSYRGEVRILQNGDGTFDVINYVPLEAYLAGVVGAEMPSYWEPEALKAQAITSRTYCLYIKERFGPNRTWDVNKTQANQVYLGIEAESPKVWDAVRQTTGKVLYSRSETGSNGIFPAYFSSICGGHTETSRKVFGDYFESLNGVNCPYCRKASSKDMFFWPVTQIDKNAATAQLVAKYPNLSRLGPIVSVVPTEKSMYEGFSRNTMLKLVGANGQSEMIRAEDFRLGVDSAGRKIRSTIFQVSDMGKTWSFYSGRGFGHGVGFCQYGSEGMARAGSSCEKILGNYFPGASIVKLY
jgi:stage II sporulation protein D